MHRTLKVALRDAVRRRAIPYNPLDLVTSRKAAAKEMVVLTDKQGESLLTQTETHRLHALFMVLLTRGLRIGEATALTSDDVDLHNSPVTVRRAVHRQRGKGKVLGPTKTAGSSRTVELPTRTVTTLRRHRVRQAEERLKIGANWHEAALIFPTRLGSRWTARPSAMSCTGLWALPICRR